MPSTLANEEIKYKKTVAILEYSSSKQNTQNDFQNYKMENLCVFINLMLHLKTGRIPLNSCGSWMCMNFYLAPVFKRLILLHNPLKVKAEALCRSIVSLQMVASLAFLITSIWICSAPNTQSRFSKTSISWRIFPSPNPFKSIVCVCVCFGSYFWTNTAVNNFLLILWYLN